jgi:hypothetical protein
LKNVELFYYERDLHAILEEELMEDELIKRKFEIAVVERKIIQSIMHNKEDIRINIIKWYTTILT